MPVDPVPHEDLRWSCPSRCLEFGSTTELTPADSILGQPSAAEALRFGLRIDAFGQNVYVRGMPGTGRLTLVREVLREVSPQAPEAPDRCYVHDFEQPDQPRLLSLAVGTAPALQRRVEEMIRFIREDLDDLLETEKVRARTRAIDQAAQEELQTVSEPFDSDVRESGLVLVSMEGEEGPEAALVPVIEEEPVPWEQLGDKVDDPDRIAELVAARRRLERDLEEVSSRVVKIRKKAQREQARVREHAIREVLADAVADMRRGWPACQVWLDQVIEDVAEHHALIDDVPQLTERYKVNVLTTRPAGGPRPVVIENVPTVQKLVGSVDPVVMGEGQVMAPHMGIHGGSLLAADGGTLILTARDLLTEPGAWQALVRTLRSRQLELTPQDQAGTTLRMPSIKPEPVPINVKVVLIGDPQIYYALDMADPDFPQLFKVLVDFDGVIDRSSASVEVYGRVIARLCSEEGLPPFTAGAVGALVEHGARVAAEAGKLTARFGRIADIAREAAFRARQRAVPHVGREDVESAVMHGKLRADLPGRRFRERVAADVIHIETEGRRVGQVNGLAVIQAGPLTYGFPSRITATVGPGTSGAVHIEREALLSGQIHTKGFLILRGLLRYLLRSRHPLVFDASVTHEQSYGGIDGDSASGAELCCLLSALTDLPVRQGLAMTGAIDQHGRMLPVGAVDEKIEGFFDTCQVSGLTGRQGVIVPRANVGDLQLRRDVAESCRAGRFAVYAVADVREAVELFVERSAGEPDDAGRYPEDSVLGIAVARVEALWRDAYPEKAAIADDR